MNLEKTEQTVRRQSNGNDELARLAAFVREQQAVIAHMSKALAKAEQEREWYRKAICEYEREKREFEDVDIATLEAMSAGPVEPIR